MAPHDDDTPDPRRLLHLADRVHPEGDPLTPEDLDIDRLDRDRLLVLYGQARAQSRAARAVERAVEVQLGRVLGEKGAVGYGDAVLRYRRGWKERFVGSDHDFWAAVARLQAAGELDLSKLFNPNSALRSAMPQALRDTFFVREDDPEPRVQRVPLSRAPKFLQDIEEGEWR